MAFTAHEEWAFAARVAYDTGRSGQRREWHQASNAWRLKFWERPYQAWSRELEASRLSGHVMPLHQRTKGLIVPISPRRPRENNHDENGHAEWLTNAGSQESWHRISVALLHSAQQTSLTTRTREILVAEVLGNVKWKCSEVKTMGNLYVS